MDAEQADLQTRGRAAIRTILIPGLIPGTWAAGFLIAPVVARSAIAGLVLSRDRLMGIGQAITMPLFFASNALYPVELMPGWLQVINHVNPLSYEVDALRGLLIGTPANLPLDFAVLVGSAALMITGASALLPRLVRG